MRHIISQPTKQITGVFCAMVLLAQAGFAQPVAHENQEQLVLTLEQARQRTLERDTRLKQAKLFIQQLQIDGQLAGKWNNPEIELKVENLNGGSGEGDLERETEFSWSQELLLPNRRKARSSEAEAAETHAETAFQSLRSQVLVETTELVLDLVYYQERVHHHLQMEAVLREMGRRMSDRVQAGKIAATELNRLQLEIANHEMELARDRAAQMQAKRQLKAIWQSTSDTDIVIDWDQSERKRIEEEASKPLNLIKNPSLNEVRTKVDWANRQLDLVTNERKRTWRAIAGIKRFEASGDTGVQLGVATELPLFRRGREETRRSMLFRDQVEHQAQAMRSEVNQAFLGLRQKMGQAKAVLVQLEDKLIPLARKDLQSLEASYDQGRHDLRDVLERHRSVHNLELERLEWMRDLAKSYWNLKALSGG